MYFLFNSSRLFVVNQNLAGVLVVVDLVVAFVVVVVVVVVAVVVVVMGFLVV